MCISILSLALLVMLGQRTYMVRLNKRKERIWEAMSAEEKLVYQTDKEAREADGNKRLDFRFAY